VVADRFKNANDDYSSILCKALADRLAEAFAERMHARVRREFWGYGPDETLAPDNSSSNNTRAFVRAGYPAQPDHTEKATLFALLDAENTAGVKLTESLRDVAGLVGIGLYFSHPKVSISASARSSATSGGLCRAKRLEPGRDRALGWRRC